MSLSEERTIIDNARERLAGMTSAHERILYFEVVQKMVSNSMIEKTRKAEKAMSDFLEDAKYITEETQKIVGDMLAAKVL